MSLNADGSASGFGAPCGMPGPMLSAPPQTCYWLVDNLNGRVAALNYYDSVGDGAPETSSGSTLPGNVGWGSGTAYVYWYEMGIGPTCSAPESVTLWRNVVRCDTLNLPSCYSP